MRCDLHVHTVASGMCNTPGIGRLCRESYNDPAELYARLKQRGMSLVTLTDHDSIGAAETLRRHRDFFLSEEVTCTLPSGTQMHLGVYGIGEREHQEIQRRRNDFLALLMYLTERKLFFSVNHVFSGLTGRRTTEDFQWFASYVPAYETRNGQMLPQQNAAAERLAARHRKIAIGGSDAHTLAHAGDTYTEVPGARTVDEFLSGLRAGRGVIRGAHGSYAKLTGDVLRIAGALFREKPAALLLAPLAALVPAITLGHWLQEQRFCRQWTALLEADAQAPHMLWDLDAQWETNGVR
ncbi:MAG: PHP domain-containing protein [Acidobacteriia bacterium]|nr:PHP domain-containing protein [Terriglobia bacterium]